MHIILCPIELILPHHIIILGKISLHFLLLKHCPSICSYNISAQLCVDIVYIGNQDGTHNPTITSMHNVSMLLKQSNVCGWTYKECIWSVRSAYSEVAHYIPPGPVLCHSNTAVFPSTLMPSLMSRTRQ